MANLIQPDIFDAAAAYRSRFFDHKAIVLHIRKALAIFPSFTAQVARVDFVRPIVQRVGRSPQKGHSTTWCGDRWLCTSCCALSHFRSGPSFACRGVHSLAESLLQDQKGHCIAVVVVDSLSPLFFCRKCGCFAACKGVGLFDRCRVTSFREADRMGKQCLRRIAKGKHPTHKTKTVSKSADLCLPQKCSLASSSSMAKVFAPS